MFRRNMFEAILKMRGKKLSDVSDFLQVNRSTIYKKVSQETDFTRAEVQKIKEFLELSEQETVDIFFA